MKFSLSWLKDHLKTDATIDEVAAAMTMAGLEVEGIHDPARALKPFSVAKVVSAARHPNADKLQVLQVETIDGMKEIVCGAPNARAGMTSIYAPIGAYVPGLGVTLVEKPVRGVVSNGMMCSGAELELTSDADGILDLSDKLEVGTPAASVFGAEPVIDFEVTPNRPDWLGVHGIARDLAATGLGAFAETPVPAVPGRFPCPITVKVDGDACPFFSGRVIRAVRNGPSPAWLQDRLKSIGLKPISALVDITNYLTFDRARPLHVYDLAKLSGTVIEARLGHSNIQATHEPHAHSDEQLIALDGKTYDLGPDVCVITDANGSRPIGLGGIMGGESTKVDDTTTDVFLECAWFDPIRTAQANRDLKINSDAGYRFARGVDPGFVVPGLELATQLILDICGGEASGIVTAGELPGPPQTVTYTREAVKTLTGLNIEPAANTAILQSLGFTVTPIEAVASGGATASGPIGTIGVSPPQATVHINGQMVVDDGKPVLYNVTPPSWRRDVDGKADLVEEVARIHGFNHIPATPLPVVNPRPGGVLTAQQARARTARRALAAFGYSEAVTWSFMRQDWARLFDGGDDGLVLANPIASELNCMRPSALPNLLESAGRNAARGHAGARLFEIGPIYQGLEPADQKPVIAAVRAPDKSRGWQGRGEDALFALKSDLLRLLDELNVPVAALQLVQGQNAGYWHPGRSARLQLGPKQVLAEFGELHPAVLQALDLDGQYVGFEVRLDNLPAPKVRSAKSKGALKLSPFMPLTRDFAFLVPDTMAAGDLVRAVKSADRMLIADAAVFDLYTGPGVPDGRKSLAVEVTIQPVDKTLTEPEIETVSARIVAAAAKAGAVLRG